MERAIYGQEKQAMTGRPAWPLTKFESWKFLIFFVPIIHKKAVQYES